MTVLHLISSEGYYGAESMLTTLARNSSKCGWNSVVAVFQDSRRVHLEVADEVRAQGIEVETILCDGRCDTSVIARIRTVVSRRGIDVLHTHGYKADLYGRLSGRPERGAIIATCHNWPSPLLRMRFYAGLDRVILRSFDRVVAVSDSVARILRDSGLPASRLELITNGVDVTRFALSEASLRAEHKWGDAPVVGFVGRLIECKGGPVLLRAAQTVLRACPNAKFAFIGDGPLRDEWIGIASRLGIADHVFFEGARRDMPGVYASLDMLVLPSFTEATPMCVLEAMAAGKPVVGTSVGGVPAMVVPGTNGLLVNPGDPYGLATAILDLLNDNGRARMYGENGRRAAAQYHSATVMAQRYAKIYESVLERRSIRRIARSRRSGLMPKTPGPGIAG